MEYFQCLEEIDPLIDEYEKRSQNKLKIKKSLPDIFCLYVCTEQAKCQYQIFFGKRLDGLFVVKQIVSKHFGHPIMIESVASRQPKSSTNNDDNKDNKDNKDKDKDEDNNKDNDDKEHDSDASFNTAKSRVPTRMTMDGTGTVDKLFQDLLTERNIDAFACLEDIDPIVDLYQKKLGNHLSIARSLKNSYLVQYVCKEHLDCTFQVFVGRYRGDGMFSVKRIDARHSGEGCNARAPDGWMRKKQHCGKLDNMIVQVVRTKKEKPTPAMW